MDSVPCIGLGQASAETVLLLLRGVNGLCGGNLEDFKNNWLNFKKKRYKVGFCASFLIVGVVLGRNAY